MKATEEVNAEPEAATPMELMCATVDNMALAIRVAVIKDDRAVVLDALETMELATAALRRWVEESVQ